MLSVKRVGVRVSVNRVTVRMGTLKNSACRVLFRLDALALSVIATATWLGGWLGGCLSQPVLYQND